MPDVSPVNIPALSVNPVRYPGAAEDWESDGVLSGEPFVYDRGTQTVHLGPNGYGHSDVRHLARNHLEGPIFNGYIEGGGVSWYSPPDRDERDAIVDTLSHHQGKPLANFHDDEDDFSIPAEHYGKVIQCPTCGDLHEGPDCPRCMWGGWNTAEDNLKNPLDPTTPLKSDIRPESSADKAKVIYQKFRPEVPHRGQTMPFIYSPQHDTVFIGPPKAYHWELLSKLPEIQDNYVDPWENAPFLQANQDVHGRFDPVNKLTDFFGGVHPDLQRRTNDALGVHPPDDGSQFRLPAFSRTLPEHRWFWPV